MKTDGIQSSVPLVDVRLFLDGDRRAGSRVVEAVDRACREIGFLMITGHQVPAELIEQTHRIARQFFSLPIEEKLRSSVTPERYRGYVPPASEGFAYSLDSDTPPDLRESFVTGPIDVPADNYHAGPEGSRYFAPNLWPPAPPGLRVLWEAYYREMEHVAGALMRIFALALELPENFFERKIDRHITIAAAMYYPALSGTPQPGQLRSGAHTDYGSLTMVHTDTDVGGIEVLTPAREWARVPHVPGSFIVNLGDLMAEWTNDRWVSTFHRVGLPGPQQTHRDRLSLIFFHQPNYDAVIECLQTCTGPGNPPRYAPVTSGAHREAKITKHRTLKDLTA